MTPLSHPSVGRAILQHVARSAAEDTDNRDGWCRWSTQPGVWPWEWDDYKPLVNLGLLERKETWKDILLRLTPAGWLGLNSAPATLLPETTQTNVRGQVVDGDVLP
jgi:hypothetical protein